MQPAKPVTPLTIGLALLLTFTGLLPATLFAQPWLRLNCTHIGQRSGLSGSYVRKVVQDSYGFIWIATEDGLNRYDARNIVVYNKGLTGRHAITGSDIWDIALDSASGLLWDVTSFGGIDAIDVRTGNVVYSYFQMKDAATSSLRFTSLCPCPRGLLAGSTEGLFLLTPDHRLSKLPLAMPSGIIGGIGPGKAAPNISRIVAGTKGRIWLFCSGQGVLLMDNAGFSTLAFLPESALRRPDQGPARFYDAELLRDGSLLTATSSGLHLVEPVGYTGIRAEPNPFPAFSQTRNRDIYSCRQDADGNIWFCSTHCLARITADRQGLTLVREHSSLDEYRWMDAAFDIFFDKDNALWLGCQQGLLYSLNRPSCFTTIRKSVASDALIRHAYYIDPVNDSTLYCCAQDGLFRVNPISGMITAIHQGKPFYHVFKDPLGNRIASAIDEVTVQTGNTEIPINRAYPEFAPVAQAIINSHCLVGDSLVVFGTENDRGILVWNFRRRTISTVDKSSPGLHLAENTVNTVYRDREGRVWVLGDNSVSILDLAKGKMQSLNTYGAPRNGSHSIFFDVCEIAGRYYLASYSSGVLVLDPTLHIIRDISTKDGLSSNNVYKLLPYRDSLLFVTSNNGISVVDVLHHYRIRRYYASDGLHSDNFEENSGGVLSDKIYAGGADGLTVITPSLMPEPAPVPAIRPRLVSIETGKGLVDSTDMRMKSMDIPNDALQASVYFSVFAYPNPERVRLSYRIRELNGGWIDMGKRDFINFIGQNPGTYTLEVRASNMDDSGSTSRTELSLVFLPKWYQTLWFKLLVLLLIVAFFYGLYRYRLWQLQQQQKIRRDIASDLHDDLGSTLNSVKIYSHLARREQEKDSHLERIEESISQATLSLRDLIWVLDDQQDTIRELLDRIKKFGMPLAQASGIRYETHIDRDAGDRQLTKTAKRNLLLIAKESINNSIKYARCGLIRLDIALVKGKIVFTIGDDGQGFDLATIEHGHGLKNIQQRAGQIRYSAEIVAFTGKGTTIRVTEK
jgi:ligand-binding sensor domain-containing protein